MLSKTIDDGADLSKLLQYKADSNAENTGLGALSQTVKYHKIVNEGVESMCKAVEDYANSRKPKSKLETIKNMLKDGLPLEKALKYTGIDEATYKKNCQRLQ